MSPGHQYWPGDDEPKPAPPPLRRIQALVNTVERPDGADRLVDPGDARPWLIDNDLLAPSAQLTVTDLALLTEVREALRALLVRNGGGPDPTRGNLATLRRIAAAATVRTTVGPDGEVLLAVAGENLTDRLAGLLLPIRDAQRDGSWSLLKACGNDECQWAFYDMSRNHGGTWCDMASCGNKLKNREFRARKAQARGRA
ncbi:MAG TPA: CGNR zinc finger domain-containing protein [Mycobacterium sp.]|jgi:predicted RNA-binding Zn ribbon-like protein|nr:CGNR zinc finger domain-containing protein [Mycobacterium sp.]